MKTFRRLFGAAFLACALAGCASDPAQVSDSTYREVRQAHSQLKTGTAKKDVLKSFDDANTVMLSQSEIVEVRVEEWKVEAKKGEKEKSELFVTFLYFADDTLIEVRDKRWDYRADKSLPDRLKK